MNRTHEMVKSIQRAIKTRIARIDVKWNKIAMKWIQKTQIAFLGNFWCFFRWKKENNPAIFTWIEKKHIRFFKFHTCLISPSQTFHQANTSSWIDSLFSAVWILFLSRMYTCKTRISKVSKTIFFSLWLHCKNAIIFNWCYCFECILVQPNIEVKHKRLRHVLTSSALLDGSGGGGTAVWSKSLNCYVSVDWIQCIRRLTFISALNSCTCMYNCNEMALCMPYSSGKSNKWLFFSAGIASVIYKTKDLRIAKMHNNLCSFVSRFQ